MDNQRETWVDEEQEWIARAEKTIPVFFADEQIQSALQALRDEYSDVYDHSKLYHACAASHGVASVPEDKQARLKEFEEKLKALIEQAETKPPPE